MLAKLGNYEEADEFFGKAVELDPKNIIYINEKGRNLAMLNRHEKAIDYFDKALELNANYILGLSNKGFSLLNLGKITESKTQFDQILLIDPNDAYAWYGKAVSSVHENNVDSALDFLVRALKLDGGLREAARQDKSFATLCGNERFDALIK